ncbi:type IV pilus assembly protein PilB [Kineothrix alysoides]|uniref:Type IV pilus assembly protein PilB n=1 Tax=Kineothrix alysoides TaxID=1469948 RepID=A0A4R1QSZ2_9FIRM|nr:ATPase, T2SS/T4P/T4SS family [Kineothrix alysoides]TCL55595.1 type IV pilus assembly protein PilB [Kineothrix alysoides]
MDFRKKKLRLGDILVNSGALSVEEIDKGLELKAQSNKRLGEVLVENGFVTEEQIADALCNQLRMEKVELSLIHIPENILGLVNNSLLKKITAMPFEFSSRDPNVLRVAMADPMDINAIDDISIVTNLIIEPVVSTTRDILLAIDKYYGSGDVIDAANKYAMEKEKRQEEEDVYAEDVNSSPIVQLVKTMIEQAVRLRASDIHIEPMERQVRVRYRIDGALYEKANYNIRLLPSIVARIKIIGGLDISEKRKPQDGRITQIVDRQEYDIRVSVIPIVYGEKVVLRLTSKSGLRKEKSQLGLQPDALKKFDHIFSNPHGIILVTGPTGSGKSTTLYTALSELNNDDVNIITVEDPVEANIDGINQVQVNTKAELNFASVLRSILRQDPDIIMIGEIRDTETATIAVQASITGHLVVSTLHTNSAASTVTRLTDMGIEPYLIADSVVGIIAQRLVRRMCPACKKAVSASEEDRELLGAGKDEPLTVYEACGCTKCDNTGYKGRIGVYEIMEVTPELKKIISKRSNADQIKDQALKDGMKTLRMEAGFYVRQGITSMQEMKKVSFEL